MTESPWPPCWVWRQLQWTSAGAWHKVVVRRWQRAVTCQPIRTSNNDCPFRPQPVTICPGVAWEDARVKREDSQQISQFLLAWVMWGRVNPRRLSTAHQECTNKGAQPHFLYYPRPVAQWQIKRWHIAWQTTTVRKPYPPEEHQCLLFCPLNAHTGSYYYYVKFLFMLQFFLSAPPPQKRLSLMG